MKLCLGICLVLFSFRAAYAQVPASSAPQIKLGGTIFADVTQTLAPKATDAAQQTYRPSAFNVTRAYLNVAGSLNPVVSFRVTSDIARSTAPGDSLDGSYLLRVKYAYAQVTLDQWTGRFTQTWIRIGVMATPYNDGRDAIYRYRFQGQHMPQREGLFSSADAGLAFHTAFPGGYGDAQIGLFNGEGYQKPEVNSQKALQGRITIRPMAGSDSDVLKALRVSAFYDNDHYMRDADRKRGIYGVTYEGDRVNVGAEILRSRDEVLPRAAITKGSGWNVFVTPFFKEKGNGPEALLRFDRWRPDSGKPDVKERLILGLSWWWTPKAGGSAAAVMLDYEGLTWKNPSILPPNQRRLTLHTLLTF